MRKITRKDLGEALAGGILFLIILLGFYWYLFRNFTPIYGINDDWTIYMVISGSYLGYPEPRVTYMLYPLAWLLCVLYGITSEIPWYALMLHGACALSALALYAGFFFRIKHSLKRFMISGGVLLLFLISNIRILLFIQYTQAAAMCGAAAVFLFLTADTKEAKGKEYLIRNIPAILMAVLSLNIRQNAFYMCLPMGGMIFLGKWYLEDRKLNLCVLKKYAGFLITAAASIGGMLFIHQLAYRAPEWKEYIKVNNIWTECVDYYGMPGYEEIREAVDANGMTKEDYEISRIYQTFYNGEMEYSDFLRIMADSAMQRYEEEHPFSVKAKEANQKIVESLYSKDMQPQNLMVCLSAALLLILLIKQKNKEGLILGLCYLFGRFFAWYYLLFAGRFPLRIPQGLFMTDLLVLFGFLLYFRLDEEIGWHKGKRFSLAALLLFLCILVPVIRRGVTHVVSDSAHVEIYQDRWYGIKEYCMARLENLYAMGGGSQTLFYFSDDILETDSIGKPQNYYINTNFDSPSPNFYQKLGIGQDEDMAERVLELENHYWIYETGCFSESLSIVQYYRYRYDGFGYELVDTFTTQTSSFEVYRFWK